MPSLSSKHCIALFFIRTLFNEYGSYKKTSMQCFSQFFFSRMMTKDCLSLIALFRHPKQHIGEKEFEYKSIYVHASAIWYVMKMLKILYDDWSKAKEKEERKGNESECMDAWKGFNFFFLLMTRGGPIL